MKLVGIAWYLFGLLIVASLLESAITYVPTAQNMGNIILCATVALAGAFGLCASWLTFKRKRTPDNHLFHSKSVSIIAMSFATIMTLVVLFGVVG